MQITGVSHLPLSLSGSAVRAVNGQPQLAGELISKAVAGMMQTQNVQVPAQPVAVADKAATGRMISTTA